MKRVAILTAILVLVIIGAAYSNVPPYEGHLIESDSGEILLKADLSREVEKSPEFDGNHRYGEMHERMINNDIVARGVEDPAVIEAMRTVPRHLFVRDRDQARAYNDHPMPIGYGQTISQPYIVAAMTQLLQLKGGEKVLELGAGSGYQAAVAAEIAAEVVTIEIVEPLARQAAERFKELGYNNVTVIHGDGYLGWPQEAPYDAIIVTAAAEHIPPPLVEQLKPGGRMIIPVGQPGAVQTLTLLMKDLEGNVRTESLMMVRFVPLLRSGQ